MNPFESSSDEKPLESPAVARRTNATCQSATRSDRISYDVIAKRLLEDSFVLTALELHFELIEINRELPRLREYFSNLSHFEQHVMSSTESSAVLTRASSAQTLDSLDFTRYSDEVEKPVDERIAVLEFELREAKNAIKSLREQLTLASGNAISANDLASNRSSMHSPSAEEICKVPIKPIEKRILNFLINEYLLQNDYKLTAVTFSEELVDQNFEDWDDVGLNVPRPFDLLQLYRASLSNRFQPYAETSDAQCSTGDDVADLMTPTNDVLNQDSTDLMNRLNGENAELLARNQALSEEVDYLKELIFRKGSLSEDVCQPAMVKEDETDSEQQVVKPEKLKDQVFSDRKLSRQRMNFQLRLRSSLSRQIPAEYDSLLKEVCGAYSSAEDLITPISRCCKFVIPSVALNKRETVVPLIVAIINWHKDATVRERFYKRLFNLWKRPEEDQRQIIVAGCVALAKKIGGLRIEAELLPHCWEHMNHKVVERRLLVAEICAALVPFIPQSLLCSLLLSIVRLLACEDKDENVRAAAVNCCAIICCYIQEDEKFGQIFELLHKALCDTRESVVSKALFTMLPCCAVWAFEMGKFQSEVMNLMLQWISATVQAEKLAKEKENLLCTYISALRQVTCLLYWSVLQDTPVNRESTTGSSMSSPDRASRYPAEQHLLDDLKLFAPLSELATLTAAYDAITDKEWHESWDSFDYVFSDVLTRLIAFLAEIDGAMVSLVTNCICYFVHFAHVFGYGVYNGRLKPLFYRRFSIDSEDETVPSLAYTAGLAVFVVGVLGAFHTESDRKELQRYLKNVCILYASKKLPLNNILLTFLELNEIYVDKQVGIDLISSLIPGGSTDVKVLCATVMTNYASTCSVDLIDKNVVPVLLRLATEPDKHVRIATIGGLASTLTLMSSKTELVNKIRTQLTSFLTDVSTEDESEVAINLIRGLTGVAPSLTNNLRDEYLLPQIYDVTTRLGSCSRAEVRKSLVNALYDAYGTLSCCYLNPASVRQYFLPGLKGLLKDLDDEHVKIADSIIRDLEQKTSTTASRQAYGLSLNTPEISVDEVKFRIRNKIMDFRDKMDQHRDSVPHIFGRK